MNTPTARVLTCWWTTGRRAWHHHYVCDDRKRQYQDEGQGDPARAQCRSCKVHHHRLTSIGEISAQARFRLNCVLCVCPSRSDAACESWSATRSLVSWNMTLKTPIGDRQSALLLIGQSCALLGKRNSNQALRARRESNPFRGRG